MDPFLKRLMQVGTGVVVLTVVLMGALAVSAHTPATLGIAEPTPVDQVTLHITTNGPHGWPTFHLKTLTIPANTVVRLTIINHDSGSAPVVGPFVRPEGLQGPELIDGKAVAVAPNDIAHTFTLSGVGLNIVVPAAPQHGTVTVVATFDVHQPGTYTWQCFAQCGTGPSGWGGPMVLAGDMTGKVVVTA